MFSNHSTPAGSSWIWSEIGACGFLSRGGVSWIYNQYHDCASDPRRWLVSPVLEIAGRVGESWQYMRSFECVIDDFGNMVAVHAKGY